jgi:hypothetical protein
VPDFLDVSLGATVRSFFDCVHANVDVESGLIPVYHPLLKVATGNLFSRRDALNDLPAGAVPKQDSKPVRRLEIVEDVLGR